MRGRELPDSFQRTVSSTFLDGAAWLASLPSLIAECELRWHVRIAEETFGLSYNFVAPAVTAYGRDVVVKIGVPCRELICEIRALEAYCGGAAVELLDADDQKGMLLLERLKPGLKLNDVEDDEEATSIAARMMRELWRPLPVGDAFPTAADWTSGLGDCAVASPAGRVLLILVW